MIKIDLKGTIKEYEIGTSIYEVAKDISEGLARNALCGNLNGQAVDLRYQLQQKDDGAVVEICTFSMEEDNGRNAFNHTATHILAQAVLRLFPEAKLGTGPAVSDGFYYDFDIDRAFTQEELSNIEVEMKKIIKENLEIETFIASKEQALEIMKDQPYKIELINDLTEQGKELVFYKQGDFVDLCAGPHVFNTKTIKAVKITNSHGSAGAYWRGDEKNKVLARIYGTAFPKQSELEAFIKACEEAIKNDHNKIGRELNFFTTSELIGQGLPLLMPKGAKVIQLMQRFVEDEEERRGYVLTKTPFIAKSDLYKVSGHWSHYKDGMFVLGDEEKEEEVFALRPMTCPFQFSIYNADLHSYKELPIRYGETSTLFRNESSGEMHGLIRVRQFTISEGHLVCTPEQLSDEFKGCVDLLLYCLKLLGMENDVTYRFSKWDENNKEKYIGDVDTWNTAQDFIKQMLEDLDLKYKVGEGEAAFYGPKLDVQLKNVYGKEDTIITVQVDFALAEKFGMVYVDKEGNKKYPIVIHRTSIGCYERLLALLIEKYKGVMPLWLAPTQAIILPLSDKYNDYAMELQKEFRLNGIRTDVDTRAEKIGYKIREARLDKIPYLLVVGENEANDKTVAVKSRHKGDEGAICAKEFLARLQNEVAIKENFAGININDEKK